MRSHTTCIEIESPPAQAFAFVADGGKLPVWAIGFATAIEPDGDRWLVTLASGERVPLRIDSDARTGVVDFVMFPAPDVEVPAHTRVVPAPGVAVRSRESLHIVGPGQAPSLRSAGRGKSRA